MTTKKNKQDQVPSKETTLYDHVPEWLKILDEEVQALDKLKERKINPKP